MKTIWKYELSTKTEIDIPKGVEILDVQSQHERPQLWVLVDPANDKEKRYFAIYGTGHKLPDNPGVYLGTFQIANNNFIFHVFEQ